MENRKGSSMSDQPSRREKKSWYFPALLLGTTLFLVGGVIRALVSGPVHARWLVAYAANELIANRVESAKDGLDRAFSSSKDIVSDTDYWRLRFELITGKSPVDPTEIDALVDEAIDTIPSNTTESRRLAVSFYLANLLLEESSFKQTVRLLEKLLPPADQRPPKVNNLIAYSRSLAKVDLGTALTEINIALQTQADPELFDTKAWVLYRLGKFDLALRFSDASIREFYAAIKAKDTARHLSLLPDENFTIEKRTAPDEAIPPELSPFPTKPNLSKRVVEKDEVANKSNKSKRLATDPLVRIIAVMRYHRACILDALNRTTDAQRDYLWLDHFHFTDAESLF
jgi:tetratricopeptide (TPR) repeat protein